MISQKLQIRDYIEMERGHFTIKKVMDELGIVEQTVRNVFNTLRKDGLIKEIARDGKGSNAWRIYRRTTKAEEAKAHKARALEQMQGVKPKINSILNAKAQRG